MYLSNVGNRKILFVKARFLQAGQAVVYIVAMLPAIFLSILLVYNTAIATRTKMGLQNTADATTYSAGVVIARNLNYLAYTNRAMAANEAGIATMASIQTTLGMLITAMSNINEINAVVYALTGASHFIRIGIPLKGLYHLYEYLKYTVKAHKANKRAKKIMKLLGPSQVAPQLVADGLRLFNYGIAASQFAMFGATQASLGETIIKVMADNDPEARMPAGDTAINVLAFLGQYATFIRPFWQKLPEIGALKGYFSNDKILVPGDTENKQFREALRFAHTAQYMRDDWSSKRRFLPDAINKVPAVLGSGKQAFASWAVPSAAVGTKPVSNSDPSAPASATAKDGWLFDWVGGTELVSEEDPRSKYKDPGSRYETGRIRWQSADAFYLNFPLSTMLLDLPVGTMKSDLEDIKKFRWGMGAGAATQAGSDQGAHPKNVDRSWYGVKLNMAAMGTQARAYGDLNKIVENADDENTSEIVKDRSKIGVRDRGAFERATSDDPRELINPAAWIVFLFDTKWRYGGLQTIGKLTANTYMPPYWDLTSHPQMYENSQAMTGEWFKGGGNPLLVNDYTDRGPTLTLTMEKPRDKVRTGENAKFGNSKGAASSSMPGYTPIGLKDSVYTTKVISSAQVYFRRPQDRWQRRELGIADPPKFGFTGGYVEHKNLFSPYWHVHNVQPSLWARLLAMVTTGIKDRDPNSAQADY